MPLPLVVAVPLASRLPFTVVNSAGLQASSRQAAPPAAQSPLGYALWGRSDGQEDERSARS
jgi:hypothetical protein